MSDDKTAEEVMARERVMRAVENCITPPVIDNRNATAGHILSPHEKRFYAERIAAADLDTALDDLCALIRALGAERELRLVKAGSVTAYGETWTTRRLTNCESNLEAIKARIRKAAQ